MTTINSVGNGLSGATGTGNFVGANTPTLITPVLGAATGTSLAFGATATNGLIGCNGTTNAASGVIGEIISSVIVGASGVALITGTAADVTSISLTAGDWDVWGNVTTVAAAGTTIAICIGWISTSSATLPDPSLYFIQLSNPLASLNASAIAPAQRINISSTTTIYLSINSNFSVSTAKGCGGIYARRIR